MTFISEHNEKHKNFQPLHPVMTIGFNPGVVVGVNGYIGKNCTIQSNVTIYDDVHIGDNCIIDSGAVIGAEGFSTRLVDGKAIRMKNVGGVRIGDGCEIGANTCIDRASLEGHYTTLENRIFIDNLTHIAHNCKIGNDVRIAPQVCVGGSTIIGDRTWISMGVSIKEHIVIEEDCFICMGSIVTEDLSSRKRLNSFSKIRISDIKENE